MDLTDWLIEFTELFIKLPDAITNSLINEILALNESKTFDVILKLWEVLKDEKMSRL